MLRINTDLETEAKKLKTSKHHRNTHLIRKKAIGSR